MKSAFPQATMCNRKSHLLEVPGSVIASCTIIWDSCNPLPPCICLDFLSLMEWTAPEQISRCTGHSASKAGVDTAQQSIFLYGMEPPLPSMHTLDPSLPYNSESSSLFPEGHPETELQIPSKTSSLHPCQAIPVETFFLIETNVEVTIINSLHF